MVQPGCGSCGNFRLNNERRYHDWKRPDGNDEAVPLREPHDGSLVGVGGLKVLFVLPGCIARQGSTDAYGGYDELLRGFWGNRVNRGRIIPFLDGKQAFYFCGNRQLNCQRRGLRDVTGYRKQIDARFPGGVGCSLIHHFYGIDRKIDYRSILVTNFAR
jgi:hypothetical protein